MTCTRCQGTGFLNIEQVPEEVACLDTAEILAWLVAHAAETDARVCDCCGDGENWHGVPGEHYNAEDPRGKGGPYAYNGGLCECN